MFFLWNQSINIIYPNAENVFIVPNHEKQKRLLCESVFILIDRWTLILKKWGSKFFLWNQSINSFIPMRRMNLQCPINKRNEIIMRIWVYPNWKAIFNSKNGRKRSSSYETKALISFIPLRRMGLWFQIMKTMEIITWIRVHTNW